MTSTSSSLPAALASCISRIAPASEAGPAPTNRTSTSRESRSAMVGEVRKRGDGRLYGNPVNCDARFPAQTHRRFEGQRALCRVARDEHRIRKAADGFAFDDGAVGAHDPVVELRILERRTEIAESEILYRISRFAH